MQFESVWKTNWFKKFRNKPVWFIYTYEIHALLYIFKKVKLCFRLEMTSEKKSIPEHIKLEYYLYKW